MTPNYSDDALKNLSKPSLLNRIYELSVERQIPDDVIFIWTDIDDMSKKEMIMLIQDMQEFPEAESYEELKGLVDAYTMILGTKPHHDGVELTVDALLEAIAVYQECEYGPDTVVIDGRTFYTTVITGEIHYKGESLGVVFDENFQVWVPEDSKYEGTEGLAIAALKRQALKAAAEQPTREKSERKPRAKRRFNDEQIREMRRLRNEESLSLTKIAAQFECSPVFVRNVAMGNLYTDVK